jgi:hypothetical protein
VEQAGAVGSSSHEEVGSARSHLGEIVGTGMAAVGESSAWGGAYFARLHPATSETLGLAASGDLHHPKARSSKIEEGVHEPVVTLVTTRHYGGGVDCNQPG